MGFEFGPAAGGERQTGAIVDGAALESAGGIDETRVVNVAAPSIGLEHECSLPCDGVGVADLNVCRFSDHGDGEHGENDFDPAKAGDQRTLRRGGRLLERPIARRIPTMAKLASMAVRRS